jgi:hypothetical protein
LYIAKFQVLNFKSYLDSGEISLKPGFNVVTGQNSAGKTALLEAMALQFVASPHRSLRTVPTPGVVPPQGSSARIALSLAREDLFGFLAGQTFLLPEPPQGFLVPGQGAYGADPSVLLRWLSQQPDFLLALRRTVDGGESWSAEGLALGKYPVSNLNNAGQVRMVQVGIQDDQFVHRGVQMGAPSQYLTTSVAGQLRTRIYRFTAERFNLGRSGFGANSTLAANAGNLPEAVNTLNRDPRRLLALNRLVSEVLPQVRQVSVQAIGSGQVQLIVWPHDPETQRSDLAIPLDDCGSGIGQVLAILYVVMTSEHPQVILIDEPQSFLHPGAVRKLIEVLKRYPQHQYVLTTHSPTVITSAEPATLTLLRTTGPESSLQAIDPFDAKGLQVYLTEIGARLSDVFGADNILWVEGQTEEVCFPRILKTVANRPLSGTAVVGIRETSDITGRDKKKILEMYRRICAGNTLLPPAIAFVLDRECLTARVIDDVTRAGMRDGRESLVRFLPRRMYENYLLHPQAIADVGNAIEGFREPQVQAEEVQRLIETKRAETEYYCGRPQVIPADWLSHIDAATVLKEIFADLSENRVPYDKMTHSVALTEWLLEHQPEDFGDLSTWLAALLPAIG